MDARTSRLGPGIIYGIYSTNSSEQCMAGPVRVVADLADRNVIALRTYVGGTTPVIDPGVANLGTVTAADATDYLLGVASRADGRVGRDAIFAALIADGVDLTPKLLDIGRDQNRPLETRRAALSGLARSDARQLDKIGAALVQIATNENDAQGVRTAALSVLSRLDHGAGIQPLVQLANGNITSWVGRESMTVLARSGDPRARQFLRSTAQRTDLPDEILAAALRGLGRNYVTGQDAALLRSIYPRLTGQRSQDAVLASLAELGGSENVQWLTGIVRDDKDRARIQATRAAISEQGRRDDARIARSLRSDARIRSMRGTLIGIYSRISDKAATDKLVWIARNEQNQSAQSSRHFGAVTQYGSSDSAGATGYRGAIGAAGWFG